MPPHTLYVSRDVCPRAVEGIQSFGGSGEYAESVGVRCAFNPDDMAAVSEADSPCAAMLCTLNDLYGLQAAGVHEATVIIYLDDEDTLLPEGHVAEELMQVTLDSLEMLFDPDLWGGGGLPTPDAGDADMEAVEDDAAYRVAPQAYISSFKAVPAWDASEALLSLVTPEEQRLLLDPLPARPAHLHRVVHIKDDQSDPAALLKSIHQAVSFLESKVAEGRSVLVHCVAGVSRSASVLCAYLLKAGLCGSVEESLACIRTARPWVQPNDDFMGNLKMYEGLLRADPREGAHPRVYFDPCFVAPMLKREKRATTRRTVEAAEGAVVAAWGSAMGGAAERPFAWLLVTGVDTSFTLSTVTPQLASVEGMSVAELQAALRKYYPGIPDDASVVALHFEVILPCL